MAFLDEEGNWRAIGVSLPESGVGMVSDIQDVKYFRVNMC